MVLILKSNIVDFVKAMIRLELLGVLEIKKKKKKHSN